MLTVCGLMYIKHNPGLNGLFTTSLQAVTNEGDEQRSKLFKLIFIKVNNENAMIYGSLSQ